MPFRARHRRRAEARRCRHGGRQPQGTAAQRGRFVRVEALRTACARVSSAIFGVRAPNIGGQTGTACASDSKTFGGWGRHLMTEWRVRLTAAEA